jgi:hypothetical protein
MDALTKQPKVIACSRPVARFLFRNQVDVRRDFDFGCFNSLQHYIANIQEVSTSSSTSSEAMKPRAIPIASSSKVLEVQPTKVAA